MVGRILEWSTVLLACGHNPMSDGPFQDLLLLACKMRALERIISKASISNSLLPSSVEGGDKPRGSCTPFDFEYTNGIPSLSEWKLGDPSMLTFLFLSIIFLVFLLFLLPYYLFPFFSLPYFLHSQV